MPSPTCPSEEVLWHRNQALELWRTRIANGTHVFSDATSALDEKGFTRVVYFFRELGSDKGPEWGCTITGLHNVLPEAKFFVDNPCISYTAYMRQLETPEHEQAQAQAQPQA